VEESCPVGETCFHDWQDSTTACVATLVLIPKSNGGAQGIRLLESTWKVISGITKQHITDSVQFEDALHGFRSKQGTGTAILEVQLNMDLNNQRGQPLHHVFLDLGKAYDTLDRTRTLELLKQYGIRPNLLGALCNFWDGLMLVPCQGSFHGRPLRAAHGVTQGDPLSSIIFNIIVDAVVCALRNHPHLESLKTIFYADDGLIVGPDPLLVQERVNILTDLFHWCGIKMNASKTKTILSK
jgi:Reverse transcriptase (RNA-dependent DNA polymerase)